VLLTFPGTSACFASLGLALVSLIRSAESVTGAALGTLLPLAFVTDILLIGPTCRVSSPSFLALPARHATRAITLAAGPPGFGVGLQVEHLAVILAWRRTAGCRRRTTPHLRTDTSRDPAVRQLLGAADAGALLADYWQLDRTRSA
jgi:hypothetical protein